MLVKNMMPKLMKWSRLKRFPFKNRPVYNRPLITDHSKQTAFITDLFLVDPFINNDIHNRQPSYGQWRN